MSLTSNWFCLLPDFNELVLHIILCVWFLVLGIITMRFVCDIMHKLYGCVCAHACGIYIHVCVCVNVHICACGWGTEEDVACPAVLLCLIPLRQDLSRNLELGW